MVFGDTDAPEAFWSADLGPLDGPYGHGFRVHLQYVDPVNECGPFFTLDGSEPTADPRIRYTDVIVVPGPATGRTATTTLRFFAQDNGVPPNSSPVETVPLTVALPHTDDDHDGFTEDKGQPDDPRRPRPRRPALERAALYGQVAKALVSVIAGAGGPCGLK